MKKLVALILLIFKLWILVKKITNSKFASRIPLGCFQKTKAQTHLLNVISQADLAFSALLKQKRKKIRKTQNKWKKKIWKQWFLTFFFSFLCKYLVSLMVFLMENLQSKSESDLRTTGSLAIWWKINWHLCDYFQRKLT